MHILITGANRGIGLELARQYLMRGDTVLAGTRDPAKAPELDTLPNDGNLKIIPLDVADENSIRHAHELAAQSTERLDILINNAGVWSSKKPEDVERLGGLTQAEAELIFRVNAIAPFLVAQAFHDLVSASKQGKVVSITSGYGSVSRNSGEFPYWYSMSKAALNMGMRTFAREAEKNGFVAAVIDPGWVRTAMGGPQATLSPEESVRGILQVIDGLTAKQSGKFLDYRGREEAW